MMFEFQRSEAPYVVPQLTLKPPRSPRKACIQFSCCHNNASCIHMRARDTLSCFHSHRLSIPDAFTPDGGFQIFAKSTQRLPKHAHRLKMKEIKLNTNMQQKKPTMASGPTVCTSSPLIGIQISVARDAMKYRLP